MRPSTLAACLILAGAAFATPALAELKPGDRAPTFTVPAAQGGKVFTFDLAAALRKGPVVLYFYPKSFTSVCTEEAHDFAANIAAFEAAGASVIGVSGDPIAVQREFSSKECRDTFPVGADPGFAVSRAYDAALSVPGTSIGFDKRVSYVIASDGRIAEVYADSSAANHIRTALATVRALQARAGSSRRGL